MAALFLINKYKVFHKKIQNFKKDLKGIFKVLEGQKNARGQWVGHPWFRAPILQALNLLKKVLLMVDNTYVQSVCYFLEKFLLPLVQGLLNMLNMLNMHMVLKANETK